MKYLYIFLFTCLSSLSYAQDYLTSVRHYDKKDGLNTRSIRYGFKDSQGFLWFTSNSGAYRFDGYQFKSYKRRLNREEPFAMNQLGGDADGNIWFFQYGKENTPSDISILPFGRDSLVSFAHFFDNNTPFLAKDIQRLIFQEKNIIHILTDDGQIYEYVNHSFIRIFRIPDTPTAIYTFNILKTADNYYHINYQKEFLKISPDLDIVARDTIPFLFPDHPYSSFFHLRNNAFLFSQYQLTPQLEELFNRRDELNLIDPNASFNYLLNNKSDTSYDLELIDLAKNTTIDIEPFGDPNTIIAPSSFYVENENSIWLMTHDGVYHIKLIKKRFNNFLPGNNTREIVIDENRNAWITSDQGLHKINLTDGNVQSKTGLNWNTGRGLFLENKNTLWVTNLYGKVLKINTSKFEIQKEYSPDQNQPRKNSYIFARRDRKTKQLWVGTDYGLLKYDSLSDSFLKFEKSNSFSEFDSTHMMHFFENEEFILIATPKGIFQLDPQKGIVQHFCTKNNTLPHDNIIFIHQDKKNKSFWLGTRLDGLIHWDKETGRTEVFTEKDGLVDHLIYAVYEDEQGFLWLPSNFGLMQFNKKTHDIVTYTTKDGIPNDEFNYYSHQQDEDGTLYMGGLDGITIFHPKNFSSFVKSNARLQLINVEFLDEQSKSMISKWNDFKQNKKIILQPADKSFRLSFTLLDFNDPKNNRYEYKIDGYDSNWISLNDNSLSLNNLPHGKYTIVIKGRNANGEWSNQHLEIPLKIIQPLYSKWWFKILAAFALIGFILFIIRRRTANLLMEKEKLEQEVARRTKEIKKQAEELKQLNEVKTRFFANVTHELRTPLTLIISPLKQLMKAENLDEKTMKSLTTIAQNGEQLKNLVEEILDLSRYDANKLEVNKKSVHFLTEVRKWVTGFDLEAQHRGINFQLFYQLPIDSQLIVDDQKLKKIITNLLSNAFKYSKNGDSITLDVSENQNKIQLKVSDTGRGIHPDDLPHIFNRFFQSKQTDAHLQGGLGIGLALSKELAELIDGQLSVQSTYGSGAIFTLEFPKEASVTKVENLVPQQLFTEKPLPTSNIENSKNNILIVEDNIQMSTFIQELLHPSANTFIAANGIEALRVLENPDTDIHLIISDVMMPEMDGFTLLQKLKSSEEWSLLPVIMLTALANTSDKLKAITFGVDDYLIKPFEPEELIARVNTLLQNIALRKKSQVPAGDFEEEKALPELKSADLKWLKQLEEIAFENVTEPNFKVSQLAFKMTIGERQFNRKLKKITGLTPGNYLKEIKLQKARQLLENKACTTIAEISYSVGFSTPEYFSRIYKNRFGKLPSDYFK